VAEIKEAGFSSLLKEVTSKQLAAYPPKEEGAIVSIINELLLS